MNHEYKIQKLLECYRSLKEDGAVGMASGPTNGVNPPGGPIAIAGLPPDNPPVNLKKKKKTVMVDLRRKEPRKLNMFYRDAIKKSRRK